MNAIRGPVNIGTLGPAMFKDRMERDSPTNIELLRQVTDSLNIRLQPDIAFGRSRWPNHTGIAKNHRAMGMRLTQLLEQVGKNFSEFFQAGASASSFAELVPDVIDPDFDR